MEFQMLREIIARILDVSMEEVTANVRFVEDLYADSMEVYQILVETEREFQLKLPFSGKEDIRTPADIERLIQRC